MSALTARPDDRPPRHPRARIDRFKLASRSHVRARLMDDDAIAEAVRVHADEQGIPQHEGWRAVHGYIQEIVPFFNAVAYFAVGHRAAGWLLDLLYKVSVEFEEPDPEARLPKDAVIIYVMNHRSNADYVLVSYALAGEVAISYAVGEWARAFPLETLFKAFGSYFIRRRYRDPLYHSVLERYVQLITREGVTQGIFVEGGLTRDGRLRAPKIGLLDYVLGIGRDPAYVARLYVVPVAVNYDRVLEDRTLLRELEAPGGRPRGSRLAQAREVGRYLAWNVGRLASGRFKRYGRAAVVVGAPIPLAGWFASQPDLWSVERHERLARVQALCDDLLGRVGELVPVLPVPLVCAALQSLGTSVVGRGPLLERIEEMSGVLRSLNARDVGAHRTGAEIFDRAWRMLRMRRILAESGTGYVVLPRGVPLVSYYANSIVHLLGPFMEAVRSRDSLPADRLGV